MKNFDWTRFTREIAIECPMQKIYDAWTVPKELERWFLSKAVFLTSSDEQVDKNTHVVAGNRYEWHWHLWDSLEKGIVTEADGKDHFQFTFADECVVDVRLTSYDLGTIVELTQKHIPTDDESKVNVRLGCDSGWSFYLVNLKSIYEGGIDLRNKNPNLKPMLNN